MDAVFVKKPGGAYKKRKTYDKERYCNCGTRLSVYNRRETCYTCDRL